MNTNLIPKYLNTIHNIFSWACNMVIQGLVKFSSGGYKIFPLKNTNFRAKFLLLIFFETLKIQNFLGMLNLRQRFFYLLFTPRLKTRQPVLPQHAIALLLIYQKFVSNLFTMHFIIQKCLLTHLKSLGKKKRALGKACSIQQQGRHGRQGRQGLVYAQIVRIRKQRWQGWRAGEVAATLAALPAKNLPWRP